MIKPNYYLMEINAIYEGDNLEILSKFPDLNKKKGYIVAFSFGKGAYEEVARVKNQDGITIILRTIEELIDGKVEE